MQRQVVAHADGNAHQVPVEPLGACGWEVLIAQDPEAAKRLIGKHDIHVGLALVDDPDGPGFADIENLVVESSPMEWIALVPPTAMQSAKFCRLLGDVFYDYHTLPANPERLQLSLGHAHGKVELKKRCVISPEARGQYGMIGTSPAMLKLYRSLRKMWGVDAPILISGESGTGKELAARAIHQMSARSSAPFVAVNCGALPSNLIQTELFGHERGAFTGAHQRKIGRIEAAAGGTIFLDEIGDLPLDLQVNLLHFLQDRAIERVGSNQEIHVDVRVIAASHVDLEGAVERRRFREDLYYRLNVLHLKVPPLREREGDVELLARHYFERFARERKSVAVQFGQQALRVMNNHYWPGNVRELVNRVRRAVVMSENRLLTPADLELEKRTEIRFLMTLDDARAKAEEDMIRLALRRNGNNISAAARGLGVSRATLYRLMEKKPGV